MTNSYSIRVSGHLFGIYDGDTPQDALDALNRDAGYEPGDELAIDIDGDVEITESGAHMDRHDALDLIDSYCIDDAPEGAVERLVAWDISAYRDGDSNGGVSVAGRSIPQDDVDAVIYGDLELNS